MSNVVSSYSRVHDMNVLDVNQHQYLSCLGGQGGYMGRKTIMAAGKLKEDYDYYKKMKNPENFGGKTEIIEDGKKDMRNNNIGSAYGWANRTEGACEWFLKQKRK